MISTKLTDIVDCCDVNMAADLFINRFIKLCDNHAPMHTVNFCSNAPAWLTYDYLAHTDERKYLSKHFKPNPTNENKLAKLKSIHWTNDLKSSLQCSFFRDL